MSKQLSVRDDHGLRNFVAVSFRVQVIFCPNEISSSLVLLLRVVGNPSPPRLGRARCQQYGVAAARAPAGHVRGVPRPARCGRRHALAARRAFRAHRPPEHPRLR